MLTGECPSCGAIVTCREGFDTWAREAVSLACPQCGLESGYTIARGQLVAGADVPLREDLEARRFNEG